MSAAPFGLTPDELLDVCGPSWAGMTPAQRAAYGPPAWHEGTLARPTLEDVADVLHLARTFPKAVASEGLTIVARRYGASDGAASLAEQIDGKGIMPPVAAVPLAIIRPSARRESMADRIDRELRRGRSA